MDVFRQRLEDEHDANIIITAPTVTLLSCLVRFLTKYKVPYKSRHLSMTAPSV
jgi:translation elongation factor EF-4